ncbi:uncharacterized protein [Ciconia boyciana]|uniref:uncharacterized protein n=1 Tax=Ciconia boyciana TaxID=52775 RepID=UPI003BA23A1A
MSNCIGMFVSPRKDGAGPDSAFGTRQMPALLPRALHGPGMLLRPPGELLPAGVEGLKQQVVFGSGGCPGLAAPVLAGLAVLTLSGNMWVLSACAHPCVVKERTTGLRGRGRRGPHPARGSAAKVRLAFSQEPFGRPGCQIPAKSTFLRHDTSGAPAGDGTGSRRSPERLRYRRGGGVHGRLAQRRLPRQFPLPARGSTCQILQNILLPFPQAAGCTEPPRRRLALPTLSIPFLPPCSFSRQLLTQAAFEGAPGQVAESDGARDKSAAGKTPGTPPAGPGTPRGAGWAGGAGAPPEPGSASEAAGRPRSPGCCPRSDWEAKPSLTQPCSPPDCWSGAVPRLGAGLELLGVLNKTCHCSEAEVVVADGGADPPCCPEGLASDRKACSFPEVCMRLLLAGRGPLAKERRGCRCSRNSRAPARAERRAAALARYLLRVPRLAQRPTQRPSALPSVCDTRLPTCVCCWSLGSLARCRGSLLRGELLTGRRVLCLGSPL